MGTTELQPQVTGAACDPAMLLLGMDPKDVKPGSEGDASAPRGHCSVTQCEDWNQPVSMMAEWLRTVRVACTVAVVGGKPAVCASTAGRSASQQQVRQRGT